MAPEASHNVPALVTVGMPVYNGAPWLSASIESILAQTLQAFVLVISDNASTDATQEICREYASRDSRIQYYRQSENIGVFRNYDRVFSLSSTKYFKWVSCNDICGARFLESCVAVLESRPDIVAAFPKTALFDERIENAEPYEDELDLQQELPSERIKVLLSRLKLNNPFNGVIRSEALRKTALNKAHAGSDIDLIVELAMRGKLVQVPETLFYRRMNARASSILVPKTERAAYFADEPNDVLKLRLWKLEMGFLAALWRVPIPTVERLRIARYLASRLIANRKELFRELAHTLTARFSQGSELT